MAVLNHVLAVQVVGGQGGWLFDDLLQRGNQPQRGSTMSEGTNGLIKQLFLIATHRVWKPHKIKSATHVSEKGTVGNSRNDPSPWFDKLPPPCAARA